MNKFFLLFLIPGALTAQNLKRLSGENTAEFIQRTAPSNAANVKLLAENKFNTASEKIMYAYTLFEQGNLVSDKDSSLSYYLVILVPEAENEYEEQRFKMITSYKKRARIENAEIIDSNKEKKLQVYIAEMVRGPGGLPRDVKRTFVYKQDKQNSKFTEHFSEEIQK
jgi:hypothetical protein